jgi:hypothetical protein
MATIFNRGFVRRSLPVLLALVMGFLVAHQPPAPSLGAADLRATAYTTVDAAHAVHTGHTGHSAATPAPPAAAPITSDAGHTEQITLRPRVLRALTTVRSSGSRAPPLALV